MRNRLLLIVGLTSLFGLFACSDNTVPCTPGPELCNGIDDDCDGLVDDEPEDVSGQACGLDEGACQAGVESCVDGQVVCDGQVGPGDEVCNALDDDCDGQTDQGLVGCGCTGGVAPSAEVCDGLDNDCNEAIDDLAACQCTGGAAPSAEVCDGIDNDCNTAVDDGLTGCGCTGGNPPSAEACNGVDDDCNGTVDDMTACQCTGGTAPGAEICDGIDNDCNAAVDDGLIGCGCAGGNPPSAEVCNGVDDDCNLTIDDLAACQCTAGAAPGPEVCDGVDNDCNGQIDDALFGCQCAGGASPGPEVCDGVDNDCNDAIDDGLTGCQCAGGVAPSTEVCDGVDNDCNDAIDDLAACQCTGGVAPGPEVCDGVDNDCNDAIDDGLTGCQCTGGAAPGQEVCDGVDNDCNGEIDEDNGSGGGCGQLGDACSSYLDCASQICVGDIFFRYCSDACDAAVPNSCPADYTCVVGSNLDYCRVDWAPCDHNDDCLPDEVCTVQNSDDGLGVETECRPPLDPGGAPGDDCAADTCENDLCSRAEVCSEVCSAAAPCTEQYLGRDTACVLTAFFVLPGVCGRDEQCPAGYTCQAGACNGPACAIDDDCEPGYTCTDPGSGLICTPAWQLDRVGTCQIACDGDGDCPAGTVCQLGINADASAIQGRCAPAYNGNAVGDTCTPSCDHGMCITGPDYCTKLCGDAGDCPPSWNCSVLNWNVGDLGTFQHTACTMP